MLILIIAVTMLVIGSALCSCSEAAIFSLSESKVHTSELSEKSKDKIIKILKNKDSYISTIVLLNNAINIMGSVYIGLIAAEIFGSHYVGIFSGFLTISIILFAEILPKAIGTRNSFLVTRLSSNPLIFLTKLLKPIIILINFFSNIIIKLIFGNITNTETVDEDELKYLSNLARKNNEIKFHENEIIQNVFNLSNTKAKDIMTPRTAMTYIYGEETLLLFKDFILNSEHSRIIIVGETIDEVIGVVFKSDLISYMMNHDNLNIQIKDLDLINRNPLIFSENIKSDIMLKHFQKKSQHLAIVEDSFGGTSGVVTLEDVMEILVGEIKDETDSVDDLRLMAKHNAKNQRISKAI